MKTVLVQLWEISNSDNSILPDGCSLHVNEQSRNNFIKMNLNQEERIVGLPSEIKISDSLLDIVIQNRSVRLSEIETNNLIGLKEIIPL